MVEVELGYGQQCPCKGGVSTQPSLQSPQAGETAVEEGGILAAETVQQQHGLH